VYTIKVVASPDLKALFATIDTKEKEHEWKEHAQLVNKYYDNLMVNDTESECGKRVLIDSGL